MINTLQELLEDYARFSCMEDKIDPETSEELQKGAKDYLKQLNELNLLTIPVVVGQSEQLCYEDIESTKCLTCGDETCLDAECLQ
jgi:hypothetical protein